MAADKETDVIHFFSHYEPQEKAEQRRHTVALRSRLSPNWRVNPVLDEQLPRLFSGDGKNMPHVRDVFDCGVAGCEDDEICVYTNADIMVRSDAHRQIAFALQYTDAAFAYRRDFSGPLSEPPPDSDFAKGKHYPGSDLYAFRAGWWKKHRKKYPDMLLGYEAWDPVMRELMIATNGPNVCQLPDIIAHERDGISAWERSENRYRLKGQLHNLHLASAWFGLRGIPISRFGIPWDFATRGKLKVR